MDGYRDLRRVLTALRAGRVDPARLAEVGLAWTPGAATPFWDHLVAHGVVVPDSSRSSLPATVAWQPTPGPDETPSLAADGSTPVFRVPADPARETVASAEPADGSAAPGPNAARYQVLRPHRAGGLGEVWLARDTAVGRDVALKMLRPERLADPDLRARFVREARTTGQLEHPCVVPLYDLMPDAGGRGPCYVMRFVAGRTLAEAVADYHTRRAKGQSVPLELAALLDAFVAVCRAVAFAHARGVLHRDLKGQNVVLGDFGEVFLLDWGLAKPVGDTEVTPSPSPDPADLDQPTRAGAVIGTPAYMAPEVAAGGPASRASDVYSLGAVLYAVLAGKPPYEGTTAEEVVDKVTTVDPPPPRAVVADAPPALEAVCRKAMARDPAGRYASADELATEVRRWLADEPVWAYRDPWTVRATRWARRHRTPVVAAAVVLATAAVGSAVTAGLVWREKERTATEWRRAEDERQRAAENFAIAWNLTTDLGELVERTETGQDPNRPSDPARKVWLDNALAASERFLADAPDDTDQQLRTARLYRFAANLGRLLNDTTGADRSYREAVRLQARLAERFPDDPAHRERLSQTLRDQAVFLRRVGRLPDAVGAIDRAVGLAAGLRAAHPGRPDYTRAEALARLDRAEIESARDRYPEAEASADAAADLFDDVLAGPPASAHPLDPVFRAMAAVQVAKARRGRAGPDAGPDALAPALDAHDEAVRLYRAHAETDRGRDVLHNYYRALAERARTALRVPARRLEAVGDLDMAIKGWDDLAKEHPRTPMYREGLGTAYLLRGRLRTALADPTAAAADLKPALGLLEELVKSNVELPGYRALLGEVWVARAELAGDPAELDRCIDRAMSSFRAARSREGENPAHARALEKVERRWPEAAARVAKARKQKGGKP